MRLVRQIGIGVNINFAREYLQGGNPTKMQLRLDTSGEKGSSRTRGLFRPRRCNGLVDCADARKPLRDPGQFSGIKEICGVGTLGARSLKSAGCPLSLILRGARHVP